MRAYSVAQPATGGSAGSLVSLGTGSGGVDQLVFTSGNAPASGAGIEVIGFTRA